MSLKISRTDPNEGGYEKMALGWYSVIKPYLH
jgi:hypothetical protein